MQLYDGIITDHFGLITFSGIGAILGGALGVRSNIINQYIDLYQHFSHQLRSTPDFGISGGEYFLCIKVKVCFIFVPYAI